MTRRRWLILAGILLLAASLRLPDLGRRPYHHDEAIHGYDSWRVAQVYRVGSSYVHSYDPTYHGPLLYYTTGAVFALLGDSDATGRLLPVGCGLLLVGAMFLFGRELGRGPAAAAALLLAVSPLQIYYGRFLRNDVPFALLTVLFLGLLQRGDREGRDAPALLGVAMLALAFAAKENAYLLCFVFGAAVCTMGLLRLGRRTGPIRPLLARSGLRAAWRVIGREGAELAARRTPRILGLMALAGFASFNLLGARLAEHPAAMRAVAAAGLTAGVGAMATLLLYLHLARQPRPPGWPELWKAVRGPVLGIAVFAPLFAFAFTNGFTRPLRLGNGLFAPLRYWMGQQHEPRLDGPFLYHAMMLLLHEPVVLAVPVIAALASYRRRGRWVLAVATLGAATIFLLGDRYAITDGLEQTVRGMTAGRSPVDLLVAAAMLHAFVRAARRAEERGEVVLCFVWLWSLGSFLLYGWAREKVPWLSIHVSLPFTVLTALLLGRMGRRGRVGLLALALITAAHSRYLVLRGQECDVTDPIVYIQTLPRVRSVVARVEERLAEGYELVVQSDATVPFYWYFRGRVNSYPKSVDEVRPGTVYLVEKGKGGAAGAAGLPSREVSYYEWVIPRWGSAGMGLSGLGELLDWLPRYLLFRREVPWSRGTMDAVVSWSELEGAEGAGAAAQSSGSSDRGVVAR